MAAPSGAGCICIHICDMGISRIKPSTPALADTMAKHRWDPPFRAGMMARFRQRPLRLPGRQPSSDAA